MQAVYVLYSSPISRNDATYARSTLQQRSIRNSLHSLSIFGFSDPGHTLRALRFPRAIEPEVEFLNQCPVILHDGLGAYSIMNLIW